MVRPESLLLYARQFLEVNVREASLQDAERITSLSTGRTKVAWNQAALSLALEWLDRNAPVQAGAVRAALKRGGFVPRSVVYELGGYDEDRTLRGFTRPANRITQELRDRGMISPSAEDLLEAVYDPEISYVQASGFRVPPELIRSPPDTDERDVEWSVDAPAIGITAGAETATLTYPAEGGELRTVTVPAAAAAELLDVRGEAGRASDS